MKIKKLLGESVRDLVKDNFKNIILIIVGFIITRILSLFKSISTISITISLPIIIFFLIISIVVLWNLIILIKKHSKLKKEFDTYKNPPNENINKFNKGDIVILKSKEKLPSPPKLSVFNIDDKYIYCRDDEGDITSYSPEELLTSQQTQNVFSSIEIRRKESEKENEAFVDFFSF
ncbi:hypothetical protein JYG23_12245 [Sedimentibacter sp. zth1]|uniref:hypothetical protein n=1 Tax=Sedimentibacter sp. zth1 TaxID=2816908 RepID=UPI001A911968|nr:hypothetical protein [Sedimentibacter sp. zth1]QSX05438.1 hypothetical protein JYG23_12245 [Sedimentibacter sp. zth1]